MENYFGMERLAATSCILRPSLFWSSNSKTIKAFRLSAKAKHNLSQAEEEDEPLFRAATARATLRFQETNCPEPLFVDPYACCFVPPNAQKKDMNHHLNQYCLATKFIDDRLLSVTKNFDGMTQVVLLTDGMDTRPYRLNWPSSTIIFDISPGRVFRKAAEKLEDVGAKIPRSCLFLHIPLESSDVHQILHSKGFSGNRPSIWVFEGFPVLNLANFKEILSLVSSLAMKGCFLLGEMPAWLTETDIGIKSTTKICLDNLFMSYGFRVNMIGYDEVARTCSREPVVGDCENLLFVAEHLRFSDDQMETWRREFQRLEEEADEEGFEEL